MGDVAPARKAPIGVILMFVGGALLAIGSFLPWAQVTGGGTSVTAKGVDGSDGWITMVAGLVLIVCGAASMKAGKRALAILAIVAGLVGAGVGVYDATTAKDSVLDSAASELSGQFGVSADEMRTLLDQAIDAGQLSISISFGLYVVIAGGLLGIVGGVMAMGSASKSAPMGSAAPPPPVATYPPPGMTPPAADPPAGGAPPGTPEPPAP